MAEEERLTKAERREQARAERRRKEAEEAARAKRRRLTSIIVGALIAAFVGWVLWLAFAGGPEGFETPRVVDPAAASEARGAAGCTAPEVDLNAQAGHFEPAEAPPADTLYTLRPTAIGPHFSRPIGPGVYASGVEERAVTHSMEHGGVVVWWDPDVVDGDTQGKITDFVEVLNANGFANVQTGSGLFASPFEGRFTSGKPIAFRAWGAALDCDTWDRAVADAFVVDHFGSHGVSPERNLGPFPEEVMIFGPGAGETETPNGGPATTPTDGGQTQVDPEHGMTDEPTDETAQETDDEPTDEASPTAS